jgi:hypothetical protein
LAEVVKSGVKKITANDLNDLVDEIAFSDKVEFDGKEE